MRTIESPDHPHSLPSTAAASALDACAVAIPVRYFGTQLDAVASGDERCIGFATGFIRGVAGMTTRLEGLPEPEEEPEQRIKEALRSRIEAVCPSEAAFILR